MNTRIVVADESEARFYEMQGRAGALRLVLQLQDPKARMHDRDFKSDRPGRVFDHAAAPGERRGAVGHHSTGGAQSPREHETQLFARQIGAALEKEHAAKQFDRLVLIAGPRFLGSIRQELHDSVRPLIAAEIHKDLVHQSEAVIREHLQSAELG